VETEPEWRGWDGDGGDRRMDTITYRVEESESINLSYNFLATLLSCSLCTCIHLDLRMQYPPTSTAPSTSTSTQCSRQLSSSSSPSHLSSFSITPFALPSAVSPLRTPSRPTRVSGSRTRAGAAARAPRCAPHTLHVVRSCAWGRAR
jgi:hypothetical protein